MKSFFKILSMLLFLVSCAGQNPGVKTVQFKFDSDSVHAENVLHLNTLVKFLKQHPKTALILEGEADLVGAQNYNDDLGDRRAAALKSWFVKHGIDSNRIVTVSFGEERAQKFSTADDRKVVIKIRHAGRRTVKRF